MNFDTVALKKIVKLIIKEKLETKKVWKERFKRYPPKERDINTYNTIMHHYKELIRKRYKEEIENQIKEERLKRKIQYFMKGDPLIEAINSNMGYDFLGYLEICQFDEKLITDGFTSFCEFWPYRTSGLFTTLYYPNELKLLKASFGCVLYRVSSNGLLNRIDANYDSSD